MGRGVKFKLRKNNGTTFSVTGTFVGAITDKVGQVYVKGDGNGFKDGFYKVNSSNGQEILATLDQDYLDKKGIEQGKDAQGNLIGDRTEADIQNETDQGVFTEAPEGFKVTAHSPEDGSPKDFATEDGDFKLSVNPDGTIKGSNEESVERDFKDWPDALATIDKVDSGEQQWADANAAPISEDPSTPETPQDAPESANVPETPGDANYDTDTFEVAKEGFLVPTGKTGTTGDLPGFIEANKDFLGEGGKRLVIDSDSGNVEIYNSADSLDNAKAQAGGIGVPDFIDLANNKRIQTDAEVPETPNVEDRSADPVEPDAAPAGADQPVDQPGAEPRPAGDSPAGDAAPAPVERAPEPANDALGQPLPDNRADLEQRLAYLERATQRVSPDSDQFDATYQARDEVKARLDSFEDKIDAIQESVDEIADAQREEPAPATPAPDAPVSEFETPVSEPATPESEFETPVSEVPEEPVGPRPLPEQSDAELADSANVAINEIDRMREDRDEEGRKNARLRLQAIWREQDARDNFPENEFAPDEEVAYRDITGARRPVTIVSQRPDGKYIVRHQKARRGEPETVIVKPSRFERDGFPGVAPISEFETPVSDLSPETPVVDEPQISTPDPANVETAPRSEFETPVSEPEDTRAPLTPLQRELLDRIFPPGKVFPEEDINFFDEDLLSAPETQARLPEPEPQIDVPAPEDIETVERPRAETIPGESVLSPNRADKPTVLDAGIPRNAPAGQLNSNTKYDDLAVGDLIEVSPGNWSVVKDVTRSESRPWVQVSAGGEQFTMNKDDRTNMVRPLVEPTAPAAEPEAPAAPEDEGDGLPEDVAELENMAGAMEREIAGARPARARVLRAQADRIYDKIDALSANEVAPEPTPNVEPAAPDAPVEVDTPPVLANRASPSASAVANAQALLAGKNISDDERRNLEDELSSPDLTPLAFEGIMNDVRDMPNAANTVTTPRPDSQVPSRLTPRNQELLDIETDPNQIVDPNLIMDDLRRLHPDHTTLPNGDIVVERREFGGKTYEVIVRRTRKERFMTYVRETDENGVQRAARVSNETHSYKALLTKMNRAKAAVRNKPNAWINKQRNVENLGFDGDLADNPLDRYIDGTDLPRSSNQRENDLIAALAKFAERPGADREVLDAMAAMAGKDQGFIDKITASVARRKIMDANQALNDGNGPSHVSYDGTPLQPGDWVDWTDTDQTVPQKDEFGNTIYETDADGNYVLRPNGSKIALNMPNPNYGRVYRGQVQKLRYRTNDGNGEYVYSDNTYTTFAELDAEKGGRARLQRQRAASAMRKVDQDASLSEAFWPKERERAEQDRVVQRVFDVPASNMGTIPRPGKPAPVAVDVEPGESGDLNVPGFGDVSVPLDKVDALRQIEDVAPESKSGNALAPGDAIFTQQGGAPALEKVLMVEPSVDGNAARVRTVRPTADGGHEVVERDLGASKLVAYPAPAVAPDAPAQADLMDYNFGDEVFADDIPGGGGTVVAKVIPKNWDGNMGNILYRVQNKDGGEFAREGKYLHLDPTLNAPALPEVETVPDTPEEGAPWRRDPATARQLNMIRALVANRKVTTTQKQRANDFLKNGGKKGEATDLISEMLAMKLAPSKPEANIQDLMDRLRNELVVNDLAHAAAKDKHDLAEGPDVDDYGVMPIKYKQVVSGNQNQAFRNIPELIAADLAVGDIVPNGIGPDRVYQQVVKIEERNVTYRVVAQRDDRLYRLAGGQFRYDGEEVTEYVSMFDRLKNVKRPTANAPKGYLKEPAYAKAGRRGAVEFDETISASDPALLERLQANGQELADAHDGGYDVIVSRMDDGIMHARAQILDANGKRIFVKELKNKRDHDREILSNRLANALGIKEVQMGSLGDGRTVVMDVVDGDMAYKANRDKRRDILSNIYDYDNAWRMGILDFLIVNSDRHDGNWFINKEGQPVPIDHGNAQFDPRQRILSSFADTLLRDLNRGAAPITSAQLLRLKGNIQALRGEFVSAGRVDYYDSVMSRMDNLIGKARA